MFHVEHFLLLRTVNGGKTAGKALELRFYGRFWVVGRIIKVEITTRHFIPLVMTFGRGNAVAFGFWFAGVRRYRRGA
jgi:hypothetical protein